MGNTSHFRAVAYKAGMIDSMMTNLTVDNVDSGGNAATAGSRTVTYDNDPLNRMSMNDNATVTVYGPPSGVNQYMSVSGHTLTYDTNFNLSGYDAWSYVYDAEKRLISASGSGTAMGQGHSAQFVYDGLGRCVKRTIDNVTTLITYDGWKPIAEWNGAGGLVAWNLYGPGADEWRPLGKADIDGKPEGRVSGRRTSQILVRYDANAASYRYYHLDAHGHVRFLLNGNGEVIEKYTYDAFGQPKIMDGNGGETATTSYGNRFLFTGREYLSALGLYDYRHRVYHPGLGRFMQVDPLGLQIEGAKLSAPQTALFPAGTAPKTFSSSESNLYRYCHSDPVNKNDPMGLYAETILDIGFIVYDIHQLVTGSGNQGDNWRALGLDVVGAALPVATGLGAASRVGAAAHRANQMAHVAKATNWGQPSTLARHFADHGADFGARNAEDYAKKASDFFKQSQANKFPTKIDSKGTIRVYDPKTNTFGSYNADGTTKTFYKPSSPDYFDRQPGEAPHEVPRDR